VGREGDPFHLVLMPVHLHATPPQEGVFREPVKRGSHVIRSEIGEGHHAMRPTDLICHVLNPCRLVFEPLLRPIRLHIDRSLDAGTAEVLLIFADRIITPDWLIGSEDARAHGSRDPRHIASAPDVMMGVDDLLHHAADESYRPLTASARSPLSTFSGVIGRESTLTPTASKIALAIAGIGELAVISPTPLAPKGPSGAGRS